MTHPGPGHGGALLLGGYQGPQSVHTAGLAVFAEELLACLDHEVVTYRDVTAAGATARSLFDGIEAGSYTGGYITSGYLTERVPELAVLDMPFSVADRGAAHAALDGAAGRRLAEAVHRATGMRVLGFWDNGFRHLTNAVRPIRHPRDCAGLIVRTLDNRIYADTMAAMGFTPLITDVRDLRPAVESGRVQAQENPLTNTVNFGLHHYQPHVTLTGHFFGVAMLCVNGAWFDRLPGAAADGVRAAAARATAEQRRRAAAEDDAALAVLAEAGAEVLGPGEIDRAAFLAACADVRAQVQAALPADLVRDYTA